MRILLGVLLAGACCAQTFSFDRVEVRSASPLRGTHAATGDFNGDGQLDLVVPLMDGLLVLLGKGDGTFQDPLRVDVFLSSGVYAGDFDGDGKLDLAVRSVLSFTPNGSAFGNRSIILLGNGDGTFRPGPALNFFFDLAADMNADGLTDLLNLTEEGPARVLINRGAGVFESKPFGFFPEFAATAALGDVNGDGKLDLVARPLFFADDDPDALLVFLNQGDGTLTQIAPLLLPDGFGVGVAGVGALAIADFDGDGKPDVVFSRNNDTGFFKGAGDGSFQFKGQRQASGILNPHAIEMRTLDVNGDGNLDLAIAHWEPNYITIRVGNGDGSFQPFIDVTGAAMDIYSVADLNGDGRPDLLFPNLFDKDVSVLLNTTPARFAPIAATNATGYAPAGFAPGSLVTLRGTFLANAMQVPAQSPLPTTLAGATVRINGVAAPLLYVSPTQINFQVPFEIAPGVVSLDLDRGFTHLTIPNFQVGEFAPAIFTLAQTGEGSGLFLHADGSVVLFQSPARAGETISMLCTGLGKLKQSFPSGTAPTSPAPESAVTPRITVGGISAAVKFSGLAPGYAGLYRVDFVIPADAPKALAVPVRITVDAAASNTVAITVN